MDATSCTCPEGYCNVCPPEPAYLTDCRVACAREVVLAGLVAGIEVPVENPMEPSCQ